MNTTVRGAVDPSKKEMLDYIFEMLGQLAEMADLCEDPALAQVLGTLAESHRGRARDSGQVVPFLKASAETDEDDG